MDDIGGFSTCLFHVSYNENAVRKPGIYYPSCQYYMKLHHKVIFGKIIYNLQ